MDLFGILFKIWQKFVPKPLPKPMLTKVTDAIWRPYTTMNRCVGQAPFEMTALNQIYNPNCAETFVSQAHAFSVCVRICTPKWHFPHSVKCMTVSLVSECLSRIIILIDTRSWLDLPIASFAAIFDKWNNLYNFPITTELISFAHAFMIIDILQIPDRFYAP